MRRPLFSHLLNRLRLALARLLMGQHEQPSPIADIRYQALFEQSNDAVFLLDLQGNHFMVNHRASEMLGYEHEQLEKLSYRDIVIQDEQSQSLKIMQRLQDGEKIPPYERTFRHKQGHPIKVELNVALVRDVQGRPLYYQSIARDITERKRLEESYRSAIEASLDAFYLLEAVRDAQGSLVDFRIVDVNERAVQQMAMPREVLIGGLICELFPINRTNGFFERYKGVVETGQAIQQEFYIPPGNAAPGWYHHQVVRVGDGVAIVNHDISHRKHIEDALRTSEERYKNIVQTQHELVCRYLPDSTITFVNEAYCRYFGMSAEQLIGQSFLLLIPEESRETIRQRYEELLRHPRIDTYEHSITVRGELRWQSWTDYVIVDEMGQAVEVQAVGRDITASRLAQERQMELALERERHQLLARFLEAISHEFRTPLSIITSQVYLMARQDDPQRRQQKAEQVNLQVSQVAHLVDMLLLMGKLEDPQPLAKQFIDLPSMLQALWDELSRSLGHSHRLSFSVEPDVPHIVGVNAYLAEAFRQILGNAQRYTPAGGHIQISIGRDGAQVWAEICDSGSGIPADSLDKVFQAFWRQDTAHSTPGLGLGLTIAHKIITQHGGSIQVASQEERGSCFRVLLPAQAVPVA